LYHCYNELPFSVSGNKKEQVVSDDRSKIGECNFVVAIPNAVARLLANAHLLPKSANQGEELYLQGEGRVVWPVLPPPALRTSRNGMTVYWRKEVVIAAITISLFEKSSCYSSYRYHYPFLSYHISIALIPTSIVGRPSVHWHVKLHLSHSLQHTLLGTTVHMLLSRIARNPPLSLQEQPAVANYHADEQTRS
jgi:hypothetical protein